MKGTFRRRKKIISSLEYMMEIDAPFPRNIKSLYFLCTSLNKLETSSDIHDGFFISKQTSVRVSLGLLKNKNKILIGAKYYE